MKKRRCVYGIAAAVSGVACMFRACGHLSASAAIDSVTLTPAQTRALFGDTLNITYFDGTDWQSGTLSYLTSAVEIGTEPSFGSNSLRDLWASLNPSGTKYLVYSASDLNIQSNSQYQVTLEPQITFANTQLTKFVCGVSCSSNYSLQPRYAPYNYISYYINGNSYTTSAFTHNDGAYSFWLPIHFLVGSGQYQADRYFLMYPISYNQEGTYSTLNQFKVTADATAMPATNICRFIVSCPTLSTTTSTGSGGGQQGTDLTATNAKLDSIINILSLIAQQQQDNDGTPDSVNPQYDAPSSISSGINGGIDAGVQDVQNLDVDTTDAVGLLGFAWQFLQAARLQSILSVVLIIAVVRWFIFSRGA